MTTRAGEGSEQHLLQLMEEVALAGSLDEICDRALTCLRDALGVERSSVLLFDATDVMRFVAWRGLSEGYRQAVDGHSPWSPEETAAAPILVPDALADPALAQLHDVLRRERIAALAFFPLRFAEKLLGKFMLYYPATHTMTDEEVAVARLVAGHVSFAIEHQRRFRAERDARRDAEREIARRIRSERQKNVLVQAGHVLSRSLERDGVFDALSALVVSDFADWYAVHLVDTAGAIAPALIRHADPAKVDAAWELVRRWPTRRGGTSPVSVAIHDRRSSLIRRVDDELISAAAQDEHHRQSLEALGLHSAIVVPLALPEQTIGALTFVTAESSRCYDEDDLAIAEALASRAALAIEQAQLYAEAQSARRAAEEAARRLDILAQAGDRIARLLDPDAALAEVARFAVVTLADYCVAYRLEQDGSIQRAALAHADPQQQVVVEELVRTGTLRIDDAHGAGAVLRTGQPVLASDISPEMLEASAQSPAHLAVLRQLAPRSSVIVPLAARDRTLGALAFATTDHSGRRYEHADLKLAQELAGRWAILLDNARLYRDAQAANGARDEMLSIVSHDLRSPLNTISTGVDLLELDPDEERRGLTWASMRRATQQMHRLLEDLLDVTRIDEGRLSLRSERFDLDALVSDVVSLHAPIARRCRVRVEQAIAVDARTVDADRGRLSQLLSNLVDNALKFTPEGGIIRVTASRELDNLRICVQDSGPGISPEQLPHLFDRFWRADGERHGAGLGLAIVKGIAEAHGGGVDVMSIPGEGSSFILRLPQRARAMRPARSAIERRAILVVDDDELLRKDIVAVLEAHGHAVTSATHGQEALALLANGLAPDLILMDLMMPVMDGWDLLSAIRANPRLSTIPRVIMSAVDRHHVGAPLAHVSGFLKKPVDRHTLLRIVHGHPD